MFGYIEGSFLVAELTMLVNAMLLIYIGAYTHKYIGHEIANWWGGGGVAVNRRPVGGVGRGSSGRGLGP